MSLSARFALIAVLVAHSAVPPSAHADKAAEVRAKLDAIANLNSLDASDMRPWHLKLAYKLYDESGESVVQRGIIEEWWADKTSSRISLTPDGGKTDLYIKKPEGDAHSPGSGPFPSRLQLLLDQIVHPIDANGLDTAVPEMHTHDFGNAKADCIMLTQPIKDVPYVPLGLFATYCTADNVLRVSWVSASISVNDNQMARFLGHTVPMQVTAYVGGHHWVDGSIESLRTYPEAIDFSIEGLEKGSALPYVVTSGVMAGRIIKKVPPVYPESARQKRIGGTVTIRALIGTDGRIHLARIVSSPDGDLSVAALAAVEQWTYEPYSLRGEITSVDTTITVNFNLTR